MKYAVQGWRMKYAIQGWRISYKDEGWSTKDEGWSVNKRESINTTVVGSKYGQFSSISSYNYKC